MVAAVITYDDLEYAEGRQVIAQRTTVVGFRVDGRDEWYELDLTDEHAGLLERYRLAGRKIERGAAPRPQPVPDVADVPRYSRVILWHAAGVPSRKYWKELRAWARSRGYPTETPAGNNYIAVDVVEEYENYLTGLDRARQQQAG
jgi:hypothetical protein